MNYYSRSSPVKHRKLKTPPGFLLLPSDERSAPSTSRSMPQYNQRNRSDMENQDYSSANNSMISNSINSNHGEILIIEDSQQPQYETSHNQILIVDDQDEGSSNLQQELKWRPIVIQDDEEYQQSQNQSQQGSILKEKQDYVPEETFGFLEDPNRNKQFNKDPQNVQNIQEVEEPEETKKIPRNYSFGGSNDLLSFGDSSSQSSSLGRSSNPVIRRLFDPEVITHIENITQSQKQRHKAKTIKNHRKSNTKQSNIASKKGEENWEKYLNIFMKKRSSHNKQKIADNSDKQQSETGQRYSESVLQKKQEELLSSEESGYFNINGNQKQEQLKQIYPTQQAKKQFQEKEQSSNIFPYTKSLQLLSECFGELPKNLISPYLKIYGELVKKQRQYINVEQKQQETCSMMQLLIAMHQKNIYIDNYVLTDFPEPQQEILSANSEIILALVRKLATQL